MSRKQRSQGRTTNFLRPFVHAFPFLSAPAGRYWKKFKNPVVQKLGAPASHVEFCPAAPHDFAVTTGSRIAIYDYAASKEKRAISKFKDIALSGSYRADGRLMVAGGMKPLLQVFDMTSRAILRTMKGHDGPIHVARFSSDLTHIFSTGDDCSLRHWDVSSGDCITAIEGCHADYCRTGQASLSSPQLFVTGSYDHTVRLWDLRASSSSSSGTGLGLGRNSASGLSGDAAAGAAGDDDAEGDGPVFEESEEDEDDAAEGAGKASGAAAADSDSDSDEDDDDSDAEDSGQMPAKRRRRDDDEGDDDEDEGDEEEENLQGAGSSSSSSSSSAAAAAARLPSSCVLSVDHGAPVTQVQLMPGGSTLATAGGNYIRLWDLVKGGKLLHEFSAHNKLITSLALDGTGTRLLSGGLDSLLRVYELDSYSVSHSMRAEAPILSLALSPDNARLVMATSDSSLTIKHRMVKREEISDEKKGSRLLRGGTYRYFMRGQATTVAASDDVIADTGARGRALTSSGKEKRLKKLAPYDRHLKRFEYSLALDAAIVTGNPVIVTSLIEELIARGEGLKMALSKRDEESLAPVLSFLTKHISDPRHAPLLLDVADCELR